MLALAGHYLKQSVDKNIQVNDLTDATRNILELYKEVRSWKIAFVTMISLEANIF